MPPTADISYYDSRKGYYTCFRGKQTPLAKGPDDKPTGPTFLAALTKFREIMQLANADTADQGNTVATICEMYGQLLEREGKTASLRILLGTCTSATERFGSKTMAEFKPIHVTEWLAAMAVPREDSKKRMGKWGKTYQAMALRTLVAALNWAKKQGVISRHCLENRPIKITGKRSRGKEAYIEKDVFDRLIARVNTNFADLLKFMYGTGCRPAEAYHLEARYYNAADKCIIYPGQLGPDDFVWKNAPRTGQDRFIYLNDELAEMVERRCRQYPQGFLFRTKRDTRWSNEAVSTMLRWYCDEERLNISPVPTAYGCRHTYATDWLADGKSIKVLADLIGTSVSMIERHYGHLMVDKERVRTIMTSVMGGQGAAAEETKPAVAMR
jgi:integrase